MNRSRRVVALLVAAVLLAVGAAAAPARAQESRAARLDGGGDVFGFGNARFYGSLADTSIDRNVVGMVPTGNGAGYWMYASDGGVFSFGNASFQGSMGGKPLAKPIVGMARNPRGGGYWLVASDGGVFGFGSSRYYGSMGGKPIHQPVVGIAPTHTGRGYYLVARDGGLFAFGDARFRGSMGGKPLAKPIVGMASEPVVGGGYWLVAEDGGIFSYGGARFYGSTGGQQIGQRIVGMAPARYGRGYWLAGERGGVYSYGTRFYGAVRATPEEPIVAIAPNPMGGGYWLASSPRPAVFSGPPLPANSGSGRRVVYSNSQQRVWLVGDYGVEDSWPVSGRQGVPDPGTYGVFSKSRWTRSGNGSVSMEFMVRFAHGSTLAIGFHSIPVDSAGRPIQSESELGSYRSAGCVRQRRSDAEKLWNWAPVGTTVVVTP